MTQTFDDFAAYSIGTFPSGSSPYVEGMNGSGEDVWSIESVGDATGGQVLHFDDPTDSTDGHIIEREDISGSDLEIAVRLRVPVGNNSSPRFLARLHNVSFGGGGWDGYGARHSGGFDLFESTGGDFSGLGENDESVDDTSWYWVRLRADGTTISAKRWQTDGEEPGSWDLSATDSTHGSGTVGLFGWFDGTVEYDVFGIGTNGDSAPTEPVSAGPPAAPTNLQLSEQ